MSKAKAILVVGTSESRRARTVALLTQAGHLVAEATTLDEAMAYVADASPPLVVLDFEAVDSAVAAACRRIKDDHRDTFILQISSVSHGRTNGSTATADIESCVDAYLVEPIDSQEMLALVRSLLRLQKVEAKLRDSEERLVLAQDSAGLAILDWVIPTNTFVHSDNFLDLFDLPSNEPGQPLSANALIERLHPDDLGNLIGDLTDGGGKTQSFDKEFRIFRRDGTVRWIASRGRVFNGAGGSPERMLSLSFDVTERKTAERSNAELASIVASSIDAIVSVDPSVRVTSWNAGAERLFGLSAAEMIGEHLSLALSDMTDGETEDHRRRLTMGEAHEFEIRQTRKQGEAVDLWVTSAPMRTPNGRIMGASLIMRDISPQKKREEHVRFLMRELTHRSKNLLAVIQAMARQSVTRDMTQEEFVKRFNERLAGLAGSHDLLSSVDWRGASLMELIRSQLSHYRDLFGTRIILNGDDIVIRPEAAQNFGIALHELSTNAAKYGALSNDDGRITITWAVVENPHRVLTMSWVESDGPAVTPPTRKGFGHTVMDRIAGRALGGNSGIRFEPEGVIWTLDVPAASVVGAPMR